MGRVYSSSTRQTSSRSLSVLRANICAPSDGSVLGWSPRATTSHSEFGARELFSMAIDVRPALYVIAASTEGGPVPRLATPLCEHEAAANIGDMRRLWAFSGALLIHQFRGRKALCRDVASNQGQAVFAFISPGRFFPLLTPTTNR